MLDIERIDHVSHEMCAVVESEWPELVLQAAPEDEAAGLTVRNRVTLT